jgi:hypothetical protein
MRGAGFPMLTALFELRSSLSIRCHRILEILGISDVENPSGRVPFATLSDLIGRNNIIRWWPAKFI